MADLRLIAREMLRDMLRVLPPGENLWDYYAAKMSIDRTVLKQHAMSLIWGKSEPPAEPAKNYEDTMLTEHDKLVVDLYSSHIWPRAKGRYVVLESENAHHTALRPQQVEALIAMLQEQLAKVNEID